MQVGALGGCCLNGSSGLKTRICGVELWNSDVRQGSHHQKSLRRAKPSLAGLKTPGGHQPNSSCYGGGRTNNLKPFKDQVLSRGQCLGMHHKKMPKMELEHMMSSISEQPWGF